MQETISRRNELIPIRFSMIYIGVTVFLSIAGPIKYFNGEYHRVPVVLYMSVVVLMIVLGYRFGLRVKMDRPSNINYQMSRNNIRRLLRCAQYIALTSIIVEFLYLIITGSISFSITQLGTAYVTSERSGSNPVFIFRFLTSFFRTATIGLGFFYYDKLEKKDRVITISCAILVTLIFIFGYGVQKGAADIFILFAVASYARMVCKNKRIAKKTLKRIIFLGIAVLFVFSYMQYLRYDLIGVTPYNYHLRSTGEYGFNTEHVIFKVFGDKLGFGLAHILGGYMSLGYYGLSLCLQLPFEWTYGAGSSYAVTSLLGLIGFTNIYEKTYLNRMQMTFGRHGLRTWNTIFPWLASDFTFVGAWIIMFFVGMVMAMSWKDVLKHKNALSFLMFSQMVVLVLFIPANNQIFHGYDTFFTSMITILLWLFIRRRFSYE